MSTTVNVRVDKSRLTQQLKDNSAATQQQAAQKAVDEAAAEQVRSNNEALRRRQQDANAKFRKSRHDPIGRRDGGEIVLPNQLVDGQLTGPVVIEDGAAVSVARVGIRRNTSGTKVFVYPWGIEGALGRRLSSDYDTAVSEAFGVGVEIEFTISSWATFKPAPPSPAEPHPYAYVPSAEGRRYGTSSMPLLSSYTFRTWERFELPDAPGGQRWWATGAGTLNLPGVVATYTIGLNYVNTATSYDADIAPGTNSYSTYYYRDVVVPAITTEAKEPTTTTHTFVLPAGGSKSLVVLVARTINNRQLLRLFYEYAGKEVIVAEKNDFARATSVVYTGGYTGYQQNSDILYKNEVRCVVVNGSTATEVEPSPALISACDSLIPPIESDTATGVVRHRVQKSLRYAFGDTREPIPEEIYLGTNFNNYAYEYRDPNKNYVFMRMGYSVPVMYKNPSYGNYEEYSDIEIPAFEPSNLNSPPYPAQPAQMQVLAKQLGIGYLETSDHSGKFFTPAIYEWLAGNATLTTSYSDVLPAFYQPSNANSPFAGVYLSVGNGTEESIEMRATPAQPTDITTAHTALDWVTINTGSRYGDYLVWDWGNPEYCQQRLQALGMNV